MPEQTRQPGPAAPPSLPVCVRPEGEAGAEEATRLYNITSRGATLLLARAPELGQLLHLRLPDPGRPKAQGRARLCALVWAVTPPDPTLSAGAHGGGLHRVSVVFVGEEIPASGDASPRYDYLAEEDGRFRLQRLAADAPRAAGRVARRHSRIRVPVEVSVELLGADGAAVAREQTVTENISRGGAAVLTSLEAAPRQLVRVASERHGVRLTATVRSRRRGPDGITRLHLEFIDGQWPMGQLR